MGFKAMSSYTHGNTQWAAVTGCYSEKYPFVTIWQKIPQQFKVRCKQ